MSSQSLVDKVDISGMMRHWFKVTAGPSLGELQCIHLWTDLPFEVRIKWGWYFEYRAALIKVANPRWKVETSWGSEPVKKPGAEHLKRKRDQMISKKAKITEGLNKVNRYKEASMKRSGNHKPLNKTCSSSNAIPTPRLSGSQRTGSESAAR